MDTTNCSNSQHAAKILRISSLLHQFGWLAACDGNISIRLNEDEILITPSGKAKAFIEEKDLVIVNLKTGKSSEGIPSSESALHFAVYNNAPLAKAVIHAHPPYAIAWTIAKPELNELPAEYFSELILACGRIPFVPYARPGSEDMGKVIEPFVKECRAMILRNHGCLAWGEDLQEAYNGVERLEHAAKTLAIAASMGQLQPLPDSEIKILKEMRKKLGPKTL